MSISSNHHVCLHTSWWLNLLKRKTKISKRTNLARFIEPGQVFYSCDRFPRCDQSGISAFIAKRRVPCRQSLQDRDLIWLNEPGR